MLIKLFLLVNLKLLASAGYLTQPINPGQQQIIIGAYHVLPEGVEVTYDIKFEYKEEVLLFGDLHIHSNASDGQFSAYELGITAKCLSRWKAETV